MKSEVVAFLDTNYCINYKLPESTDWTKLLDAATVRLMVCMAVVNEIDHKRSHPTLGDRAKRWTKRLAESIDGPTTVKEGVTFEVYHPAEHLEPADEGKGDARIVEQVQHFRNENPTLDVVIVSEDSGMLIRCKPFKFSVCIPTADRLDNPATDLQKQLSAARLALLEEQNKKPKVEVFASIDGKSTDGKGPIEVTLYRPTYSWRDRIPEFLESTGHRPSQFRNEHAMYQRLYEALCPWCSNEDRVRHESGRTFALSLRLSNKGGKVPVKRLKVTLKYSIEMIQAEAHNFKIRGNRAEPERSPKLFNDVHHAGKIPWIQEGARMAGSQTRPLDLASYFNDGEADSATAIGRGLITWELAELGHGNQAAPEVFYLTFASTRVGQILNIDVRIWSPEPVPIDDEYTLVIKPTFEDEPTPHTRPPIREASPK